MTTNGPLPTDTFGNVAGSVYVPGVGTVAAQGGTVSRDASNQPYAAQIVQMGAGVPLTDSLKATYSAAKVGLVPAASATDIFTIKGSATKIIRITRIEITATTTSATPAALSVLLLKRSTDNTGGTSTGSPTPVPHDSTNAAVTATVLSYTANPSALGDLVGTAIRTTKFFQTLATYTATNFPAKDALAWDFGKGPGQAIVLRGATELLAINLNTATATATASFDIAVEFTEE